MESHGNGVVDFGRFLTGFFVVMGIGKPAQLQRANNFYARNETRHQRDCILA
jgi:hypothetical protein